MDVKKFLYDVISNQSDILTNRDNLLINYGNYEKETDFFKSRKCFRARQMRHFLF